MKTYDELKAMIERRGVHPVFGGSGEFDWFIEQNAHELAAFLVHMQALGVRSVLEIGTGWRAGLARFLHDDMGYKVVSVDIHDYGHKFDGIGFVQWEEGMIEGGGFSTYDLVLLDGDHSYEAVKADHASWGTHATKVIAFHDIAGLRDCEGVKQYWRSIAFERSTVTTDFLAPDGDNFLNSHHIKSGCYEITAVGDQRGGIGYIVLAEVDAPTPEPPPVKKPAPRKPAAKKPTMTNKKPAVKK